MILARRIHLTYYDGEKIKMGDHSRSKKLPALAAIDSAVGDEQVIASTPSGRSQGCEGTILLDVDFLPSARPKVGEAITTPRGAPDQVERGGRNIGMIAADRRGYLVGCAQIGYRFVGTVERVEDDGRSGSVRLRGVRAKP